MVVLLLGGDDEIDRVREGRVGDVMEEPRHLLAEELGLDGSDVQAMTEQRRGGLVAKAPTVRLEGEVEIDEVYVVAGHKGHPEAVRKKGEKADADV